LEKSLKKKSLQKTKEKEEDIPAIPEGSVEYAEKSPPADEIEVIMQRISEVESSLLGKPIVRAEEKSREPPLPEWINRPWMFVKPSDERFLQSWREDWAKYTLQWAKAMVIHLIGVNDLISKNPFRKLSEDDLRDILNYMCVKKWCKWWDKEKTLIRIYWRTLKEWQDIVWKWAVSLGIEYLSLTDLVNVKEDFSTLPQEELETIIKSLVKAGKARWADRKTKTIKLSFF